MFQVGDEVMWCGVKGKIISINSRYQDAIYVEFENSKTWTFRMDGKWMDWHHDPSLHVIRRDKTYSHGGTYD